MKGPNGFKNKDTIKVTIQCESNNYPYYTHP